MPRKFIKRFMPDHDVIKRQKALRVFGNVLYNPNLWCLNRRSAAGAFAVGLFMAFVPLPSQMIMAAGGRHRTGGQSATLHRLSVDHQPNHYACHLLFHIQTRRMVDGNSRSILPF